MKLFKYIALAALFIGGKSLFGMTYQEINRQIRQRFTALQLNNLILAPEFDALSGDPYYEFLDKEYRKISRAELYLNILDELKKLRINNMTLFQQYIILPILLTVYLIRKSTSNWMKQHIRILHSMIDIRYLAAFSHISSKIIILAPPLH